MAVACARCGAYLTDWATACPLCRTPVTGGEGAQQPSPPPPFDPSVPWSPNPFAEGTSEFTLVTPLRRHRMRIGVTNRTAALGVMAAVVVIGAVCASTLGGSPAAPGRRADVAGQSGHRPKQLTPAQAVTLAESVGMRQADLPGYYTPAEAADSVKAAPDPAGPCTPASGAHWLADVSSPAYLGSISDPSGTFPLEMGSTVIVMPSAADATAAMKVVAAPSFATQCEGPRWDAISQQADATTNASMPCALQFVSSTIQSDDFGLTATPQFAGFSYRATVRCRATGAEEPYPTDIYYEAIGRVVMEAQFGGLVARVPSDVEHTAWSQMQDRARRLAQ